MFDKEMAYYDTLQAQKYRDESQNFTDHSINLALNTASDTIQAAAINDAITQRRFLFAGRIQAACGASEREVSPFNCSVSQKIEDNMRSIMGSLSNAAYILRLGTGIGYNFSHLRPHGAEIVKLKTKSTGPVKFMNMYDTMASTIASAGHRRGAQMGILNVDHPDIEAFIDAKLVEGALRYFNISVGITDAFMEAVKTDSIWRLQFNGKVYKELPARQLWEKIIRNAYDSAEPGVIFLDRVNQQNNLWYCEEMEATNPCAEQPLPPYGLCTLGSFNLIKYIGNYNLLHKDVLNIVEAYDNIFDRAKYAIPEHKDEALAKRRIGLGYTGIANAIEYYIGKPSYGDARFCFLLDQACRELTYAAYRASVELAKKRGPFPLFDRDKYLEGRFIQTLPDDILDGIYKYGIRNSHLISYAPCGTISQIAGNISSGVEPVFFHKVDRNVYMRDGLEKVTLQDYMVREHQFYGKTLEDCSVTDHLNVAKTIQKYTDSAVSKTVNVASSCSYEDYESIYKYAYEHGLKGMTVFRPTELRGAVITKAEEPKKSEPRTSNCVDGVCVL